MFRWLYIVLAVPLMLAVGAFFSFAYFAMHFTTSGIAVALVVLAAVVRLVLVEGFRVPLFPWKTRASDWPLAIKFVMLAVAYVCVACWTYMGVCLPLRYGDGGRLPPAVRGACQKASHWVDAHPKLFKSLGLEML